MGLQGLAETCVVQDTKKYTKVDFYLVEEIVDSYCMGGGGGGKQKEPSTCVSPVTFTNAGVVSQNFLTFNSNPLPH